MQRDEQPATRLTDLPNDMLVAQLSQHLSPRDMLALTQASKALHSHLHAATKRTWNHLASDFNKLLNNPALNTYDVAALIKHYPALRTKISTAKNLLSLCLELEPKLLLKLTKACRILEQAQFLTFTNINRAAPTYIRRNQLQGDDLHRIIISQALFTNHIGSVGTNALTQAITWLNTQAFDKTSDLITTLTLIQKAQDRQLSGSDLTNDTNYINLAGAVQSWANLYKAKLQGANLQKANLQKAYLLRADLQKSNLQEARHFDINDLVDTEALNTCMTRLHETYHHHPQFNLLRSSMVEDLITQTNKLDGADTKITLLTAAYQHPLFNEHRHLTAIRSAINAIYRAISSLNCCFFGNGLKRSLIETRSQSLLSAQIKPGAGV